MKKESFEQQLRNRMEGYEVAPPDDLWAQIEQEASLNEAKPEETQQGDKKKTRVVPLWKWTAAASAALLIVSGSLLLMDDIENSKKTDEITQTSTSIKNPQTDKGTPSDKNAPSEESSMCIAPSGERTPSVEAPLTASAHKSSNQQAPSAEKDALVNWKDATTSLIAKTTIEKSEEASAQRIAKATVEKSEEASASPEPETSTSPVTPDQTPSAPTTGDLKAKSTSPIKSHHTPSNPITHKSTPRLSVELYAYNNVNATSNNVVPVRMSPTQLMSLTTAFGEYTRPQSSKRGAPVYLYNYSERTKNYLPIKYGLSLGYQLDDRWGLKTGLNFQRLRSDFIQTMEKETLVTENTYHYIGLPVVVSYNLFTSQRLKVYGKAGGEVDVNVRARSELDGMQNDLKKDRPQLSAEAGAGIQYMLLPHLSLYAEPGAAYYFDNGSSTSTIFKEKPLNFSLQFGIRFDIR
ncbi:MAG: outer membrane beta-barrel protein [Prevotella sp.]|nr:outer membrane beta-barrel protein [Prevotella sp.]